MIWMESEWIWTKQISWLRKSYRFWIIIMWCYWNISGCVCYSEWSLILGHLWESLASSAEFSFWMHPLMTFSIFFEMSIKSIATGKSKRIGRDFGGHEVSLKIAIRKPELSKSLVCSLQKKQADFLLWIQFNQFSQTMYSTKAWNPCW